MTWKSRRAWAPGVVVAAPVTKFDSAEAIIGLLAKWSGLGDGAPVSARELVSGFSRSKVRREPTVVHDDELLALVR